MQVDDFLLTPQRIAIHLATATAVVADLHLGYREARHRSGDAVPGVDLDNVLDPLRQALEDTGVKRLVVAGDLFETAPSVELLTRWQDWLDRHGIELVAFVPGNHDRGLAIEGTLPLAWEGVAVGSWQVVHGDRRLPDQPLVQGHEHPCLRWPSLTAPCFLVGPKRLILPAYSVDAAGVNVLGDSRWAGSRCGVIAGDRVLDFGAVDTLPHRLRRSRVLLR
jgi:uncharacterized protein